MPVIVVTRLRLKDPALLDEFFTAAVAATEQAQKIVMGPSGRFRGMRMAVRMWPADVGWTWLCETVQKIDAGALTFGCPPVASRTRVSVSSITSGAPRAACASIPLSWTGRLAGMQILYERCAAVDVGKDVIAVAVRLPGDGPGGRATVKRTFKTFYGVLGEAARWLTSLGVTHMAMEATGIYSMPVYHALIEHGEFTQVLVCNAGHVKNVPGRKTDLADAEWLVHLLECGLLRGSFIPPADINVSGHGVCT